MNLKFYFGGESHPLDDYTPDFAAAVMGRTIPGRRRCFDDLAYYTNLTVQPECVRVDIVRVRVVHNEYVLGLQAVYRSKFCDGRPDRITEGPAHIYGSGYYAIHGGVPDSNVLELAEGEYIADVRTREGEILDAVHLVTNRRRVHFGGSGGSLRPELQEEEDQESYRSHCCEIGGGSHRWRENGREYPEGAHRRPTRRVVAFAGTARGVMHRVGHYTESAGWDVAGPVVMARWLTERGRAQPGREGEDDTERGRERAVMRRLAGLHDEMLFRHIVSFLIYSST